MNYNYIFFNAVSNKRKNNQNDYNVICLRDLETISNMTVVQVPFDYAKYPIRWLYCLIYSSKLKKIIPFCVKKLFFPYYFKNKFNDNRPICFVIYNPYIPFEYFEYLRKTYPNCKIVRIYRDFLTKQIKSINDIDKKFDLIMSFDKEESNRYGISFFKEYESKIDINPSLDAPKYDIFFAGVAKDRWPRLLKAYKIFTSAGLKCHYYIVNLPKEQQIELEGVEYSNKPLEYTEMLQRSIDSKCLLEINQSGAVGYTSRFLEAVMYNKKLITDNYSIIDDKFYNPKYIQCVKNVDDIDTEFVKSTEEVNYNYKDEFSPIHLIEQIDRELTELDIRETNNV